MNPIKAFEEIRDIPYRIPLSIDEEDLSCSGKVKKLKLLFDQGKYECRYRVCEFDWLDLDLPERVISLPHENRPTHVFLEIDINGKWVRVDPTWDKALKAIFPINEWDGESDTRIAIKPINIFDPEKSAAIMESQGKKEEIEKDLQINGKFYKAFNDWLEESRKKLAE